MAVVSRRRELICAAANLPIWTARYRGRILRLVGTHIADSVEVCGGIRLVGFGSFVVGRNVFINHALYVDLGSSGSVSIADGASVGDHVRLLAVGHNISSDSRKRAVGVVHGSIHVGAGCWLGSGTVVLAGVTIGDGCVIGAGSLVTRDCEPNSLYVGSPARRVRALETVTLADSALELNPFNATTATE